MPGKSRGSALEDALFNLYEQWYRLPPGRDRTRPYRAERFRQMIVPGCKRFKGGVEAARHVLYRGETDGFSFLRAHGRLDLSVEKLILDPKWTDLFTEADRSAARRKLGKVPR